MRFLVVSDIHANLQALRAVESDAKGSYDRIAFLGDVVGYGADPNAAAEWVREHAALVIRGNHDRACVGDPVVEDFNDAARASSVWTLEELNDANRAWLRALPAGPLGAETDGSPAFHICHGSPRDEDEYISDKATAIAQFPFMPGNLCFFGHTHWQGGFRIAPGRGWFLEPPQSRERERLHSLDAEKAYIVNPGSVGQPRDADPRAAYALFDTAARTVALRRTDYDIEAAQAAILNAGLPPFLAYRLGEGM